MTTAGLLLAACQHPQPEVQTNVAMIAVGDLLADGIAVGRASLILRKRESLAFEIRVLDRVVVAGTLDARSYSDLLSQARGPLKAVFGTPVDDEGRPLGGKALAVSQHGLAFESAARAAEPGASAGKFSFKNGTRKMRYRWGVVTRDIRGDVALELPAAGKKPAYRFSGQTIQDPLVVEGRALVSKRETRVATRIQGKVDASFWLGGALFGSTPALISVDLTAGSGSIRLAGGMSRFDFEPSQGTSASYQSKTELLARNDAYVEIQDDFHGNVRLPSVDFNDGDDEPDPKMFGAGDGAVEYHLSVAVSSTQITVKVRDSSMSAHLKTVDGREYLDFQGSASGGKTVLDW